MASSIEILIKSQKTVFDPKELALLWNITDPDTLKSKIYYLTQKNKLKRIHHGIYVLDYNYDPYELAGKLKRPSYVSLETVLRYEGVIFQYGENITSVSNLSRDYQCNGRNFEYRKVKDAVLFNQEGIEIHANYSVATKERAFLDMIYLNKNYYFDNLRGIDWEVCRRLADLYENKNLIKRLNDYQKNA